MLIRFIYKSGPHTGKGKFAVRLAHALMALGARLTEDTERRVDIDLQFGKWTYEPMRTRASVLRLGPAHIDTNQKFRQLNAPKWYAAKRCDGIVYQSEWSRKACRRFLGKPGGIETVIFNGVHVDDMAWSGSTLSLPKDHAYYTCIARKWLPQKRLHNIITAFGEIAPSLPGDPRLLVVGDTSPVGELAHERVHYLGLLSDVNLAKAIDYAQALIHLVYLDACPNVVAEALVAGAFVICGDQGGTPELAREAKHQHFILADKPWDFKAINLNKPPIIATEDLAVALRYASVWNWDAIQADHPEAELGPRSLEIENVALDYLNFFEALLCA